MFPANRRLSPRPAGQLTPVAPSGTLWVEVSRKMAFSRDVKRQKERTSHLAGGQVEKRMK